MLMIQYERNKEYVELFKHQDYNMWSELQTEHVQTTTLYNKPQTNSVYNLHDIITSVFTC